MLIQLRIALLFLGIFTLITGIVYPLVVTGIAQYIFHYQANGSMIEKNGVSIASELIGQSFSDPKYFWSRPSATSLFQYNAVLSSGSNYGPTNPALREAIRKRIDALKSVDPNNNTPIPVDLVTFSASGLDPHISVAAAHYQVPRVSRYRGLSEEQVRTLVINLTEDRQFGILGEPRVNVVQLNQALDELK